MFAFLKKLLGIAEPQQSHPLDGATRTAQERAEAPYKIEAPVVTPIMVPPEPVKCGCGRSTTGFCVGLHKLSEQEWAVHADNPNKTVAAKPAAKKTANKSAKKPAAKPAATKAPAKPRNKQPKKAS